MRTRRALVLMLASVLLLIPSEAFAESAPAGLPTVTVPIAVTTLVSVLLGVLNLIAQGSILNLVPVPKTWAGPATVAMTFLTGVGSSLATASQPWTGSTAFYAFAFGLFGLFGGSLPAFAIHAHTTLPKMMRAARKGILPAILLFGGIAFGASQTGCTPAQQATIAKVDQTIQNDLNAGKSLQEIEADVNTILGKPAIDIETIVMDGITLILDVAGVLPEKVAYAEAMRDGLRAKKGLPVPTHVFREDPAH